MYEKGLYPNNASIMKKETSMPIEGKWHPLQCAIIGYTREIFYILETYFIS